MREQSLLTRDTPDAAEKKPSRWPDLSRWWPQTRRAHRRAIVAPTVAAVERKEEPVEQERLMRLRPGAQYSRSSSRSGATVPPESAGCGEDCLESSSDWSM